LLLDLLADGSITLTTVTLLGPHLTPENHEEVLASACRKSKKDVEEIVARLRPKAAIPSSVRKLPMPSRPDVHAPLLASDVAADPTRPAAETVQAAVRRPVVAPLAPEMYKIQFTMSRRTRDKLRRAQDLLRHVVPNGDVAVIVDRALTILLEQLEKRKCAAVEHPRAPRETTDVSRHVPAAVRRKVWSRDGGRCTFLTADGHRCAERGFLEYHHVVPFAAGGETTAENLRLLCRAHNAHEADRYFGPLFAREERAEFVAQRRLESRSLEVERPRYGC
jgi:hypothetical protein